MNKFSDYVTSSAFYLNLIKRQIEMLCHINNYGFTCGGSGTVNALLSKGLIETEGEQKFYDDKVVLTEAGKLLIPLIKLAGLYIEKIVYEAPTEIPDFKITVKETPNPKEV